MSNNQYGGGNPYNYRPQGGGNQYRGSQGNSNQYGGGDNQYGSGNQYGGNRYGSLNNNSAPPPQYTPNADEEEARTWFLVVDQDGNGHITAEELQSALVNETVRMMHSMYDKDHNGTIEFHEFYGLWRYVIDWKKCFRGFDTDNSGTIDAGELKAALNRFGYRISDDFAASLITKWDKSSNLKWFLFSLGKRAVSFDDFIQICVTIKSLTDGFKKKDSQLKGEITIGYEEVI